MAALAKSYVLACPCGEAIEIPVSVSLGARESDGTVTAEVHVDSDSFRAHLADAHGQES